MQSRGSGWVCVSRGRDGVRGGCGSDGKLVKCCRESPLSWLECTFAAWVLSRVRICFSELWIYLSNPVYFSWVSFLDVTILFELFLGIHVVHFRGSGRVW